MLVGRSGLQLNRTLTPQSAYGTDVTGITETMVQWAEFSFLQRISTPRDREVRARQPSCSANGEKISAAF